MQKRVLCFLSTHGQDPTEVAVTVDVLVKSGCAVSFATEDGQEAEADPRMLSGPLSVFLGASSKAKKLYLELIKTEGWKCPQAWSAPTFTLDAYDGVLLPGGHDKPMRQFLESASLRALLASFFPLTSRTATTPKVVGAICHGVLALARAQVDGKSVLWDSETTTLPVHLEKIAYYSTSWALSDYYRTYPAYTADEVQSLLKSPKQYKSGGLTNLKPFVVIDPAHFYVSARFPDDAELFGQTMVKLLEEATPAAV